MKTKSADSRARRPGPAAAVVVLLHLGVLVALLQARVWPDRQALSEPTPTWLRLLPLPAEAAAIPAPPAPPPRPAQATTPPTADPALPRRPQAPAARTAVETTLFVAPETLPAEPATPAAPGASPPPPTEAPRPLNLSLPRGASAPYRHPALDDPRSNTPPPTLERRLAEVMGPSDGPITQEHLPDGSLRLRRGTSCAIVRPSRTAALDPFNLSVSPKPRQVDRC